MKEYKDGIPNADWMFYKNSGVLDYVIPYRAVIPDGYFIMNRGFMMDNRGNHSYELPTINNGESYLEYIGMNVNYPLEAKENGIIGTVYLQITISKEGKADNRRIVLGIHELVDKEAILLLNKMTVWNPAKVNGKPIDTYLIIPITFNIN